MADDPQTIREHLESIRLRTERYRFDNGDTSQLDWRDAVAALDLLDNGTRLDWPDALIISDPAPHVDEIGTDQTGRLLWAQQDPAPRGAASVTLDTIIANALRKTLSIQSYYHGDFDEGVIARVVTDALIAEGGRWAAFSDEELFLIRDNVPTYPERGPGFCLRVSVDAEIERRSS